MDTRPKHPRLRNPRDRDVCCDERNKNLVHPRRDKDETLHIHFILFVKGNERRQKTFTCLITYLLTYLFTYKLFLIHSLSALNLLHSSLVYSNFV